MAELQPPKSTPAYMYPAWASALAWAAGEASIVEAFTEQTGMKIAVARSPLDRMIDDATGANEAVARRFVEWFNETIWGEIDG